MIQEAMTFAPRPLGSTGIWVSPIGLGTVKFGRNQGVKYPEHFALPDDATLARLLSSARDLGVNLLDTAPAYGTSESRLGQALAGQREHFVIATKTGEEFTESGSGSACSQFFFDKTHTRKSVERSLKRLGTDYLDLVLVHSNGDDLDIIHNTDALETLDNLKQAGLIRAYGISTKTCAGGLAAAKLVDAVMVTFNPEHLDEREVIEACARENTGVLLKKVLASGHICHHDDRARTQALALALAEPGVSSAIIGTINPAHLRANVACATAAEFD